MLSQVRHGEIRRLSWRRAKKLDEDEVRDCFRLVRRRSAAFFDHVGRLGHAIEQPVADAEVYLRAERLIGLLAEPSVLQQLLELTRGLRWPTLLHQGAVCVDR